MRKYKKRKENERKIVILSFFFVAVVSLEKNINSKEVMLFLPLLGSVELEGVVFFFFHFLIFSFIFSETNKPLWSLLLL